jgi:small subunit ribosomal protein S4e
MYTTRSKIPNDWPINRKGTKYVITTSHANRSSIPILFVVRDILKIAKKRKEVKAILMQGQIKVNLRVIKDEGFPIQIDDVINLEKSNKNYRLELEKGKLELKEINEKDSTKKIVKIIGKTILPEKKIQLNFRDGQNIITNEKVNVGDSIVLGLKEMKIEKVLPLKEGANIEIIGGKYAGDKGKLKLIQERERGKRYIIKIKDGEIDLPFKLIKVIE